MQSSRRRRGRGAAPRWGARGYRAARVRGARRRRAEVVPPPQRWRTPDGTRRGARRPGPHPDVRGGRLPGCPTAGTSQAVIYCLDVEAFQDSDGDGIGDLRGLIGRLDYLSRLGITCLWLNPIHPSPRPRRRLRRHRLLRRAPADRHAGRLRRAAAPGRRARHPGDHRPGRQPHLRPAPVVPVGARVSPDSPYRDWYVWSRDRAARPRPGHGVPRRAGRDLDASTAPRMPGTTTGSTSSSPT